MSLTKRVPEPLNSYEQLSLLRQPNPRAPTGLRNLCVISLMLKTGIRVSEVINLRCSDLDWEKGRIYIRESGAARARTLLLDQAELMLLKNWLDIRPVNSELFFTTLDGTGLKDRYIREMIKRLARKAGINKNVYPHLLRYTFAVDFIRETKDIKLLQEAMGHREASATQIYTRLFFENSMQPKEELFVQRSGLPAIEEQQVQFNYDNCNNNYAKEAGARVKDRGQSATAVAAEGIKKNNNVDVSAAPDAKPSITMVAESSSEPKVRIPAIKCSNCSFILHYQGNCPQCGASFNDILKHWGRIL
jgi:integrase/recombinase XerD